MELIRHQTKYFPEAWCNWCGMDIIAPELWIQKGSVWFKMEIFAYWCIPCGVLFNEGKL